MKLPSYLHANKYGIYYFRSVFPLVIQSQLQKREFKRSLRTSDRRLAIRISRIFKIETDKIYELVIARNMNWTETKKMLDVLSGKIINEFKKYIYIHGAYPDNIENYEEKQAEDDAKYFLEMKLFSLNHRNVKYTNEEIDEIFGLDSDAAKDLIWRKNGVKLSKIESIKNYANKIIESNELVVKDNDYELFVQNVAEMLWNLSEKRKEVVDNFINNIDETYEFSVPQQNLWVVLGVGRSPSA